MKPRMRPRTPCIGWEGPCSLNGQFHACTRRDGHIGDHVCKCGVIGRMDRYGRVA
jgi:hypothetical protein